MDPFDLRLWNKSFESPAIIDQIVIDTRRIDSKRSLFVALPGLTDDGHLFVKKAGDAGACFAIVKEDFIPTPDLPESLKLLYVKDPLNALQEIAHAYRMTKKARVIAITGSYGKTMIKDLLHAFMCKEKKTVSSPESFNSQIGVALSLLRITDSHEIAVIEAAVSKKDEMDRLNKMISPDCCIVTHIGKKHQVTLGDLNSSALETAKLVTYPSIKDWVLIPNNSSLMPHLKELKSLKFFWNEIDNQLPHAKLCNSEFQTSMGYEIVFPDGSIFSSQTTSGFHYFLDLINIAIKAAWLEGVSKNVISQVLDTFKLEPMRTELWQSQMGSTFINDIYCSDPQSVDQSLKYLDQSNPNSRKTFIFGGMKGQDHHQESDYKRIGLAITKAKLEQLMLIGNHPFLQLVKEVRNASPETKISFHPSMEEAIQALQISIQPNDLVLIKGEKKESLDTLTKAFDGSISNNQCTVNLAAIQANLLTIRKKIGVQTRIMVMVKALAYGTSDIRMAKFLKTVNVDILGVSYVDEGVSLKKSSVTQEIFVLNAVIHEIPKVIEWNLSVGVSEIHFIKALNLEASICNKKIKVHLHVNTGMNRFGCLPEEALSLAKFIQECPFLILDGIMTHFAAADDKLQDDFTKTQANIFTKAIQEIESYGIAIPWKHACNSSALMRFDFPDFNMVRIGLSVYGLYPSKESEHSLELKLALSLVSRVVGINSCKMGDTISYGRTYMVNSDKKIAVLPIGYFDGLHRNYSGKGFVIIGGKKAPMVGKICMDYMMVDVTDIPNVQIGDKVLIFGEDEYGNYLSPEDFATNGDSIIYELITCLGPRIQRVFVFEEALSLR